MSEDVTKEKNTDVKHPLNQILYGPPGTGKTYNTAIYAVAICDSKNIADVQKMDYADVMTSYKELKDAGRIAFTTFHQSYGYEEFIEGIKPVLSSEVEDYGDSNESSEAKENEENENELTYEIKNGIFLDFCKAAKTAIVEIDESEVEFKISDHPTVWKVTIREEVESDCSENNKVRIDYPSVDSRGIGGFADKMKPGDIILYTDGSRKDIKGIAVVKDEKAKVYTDDTIKNDKVYRDVFWLAKDFKEDIRSINDGKILHRRTVAKVPSMDKNDVIALAYKHNPKLKGIKKVIKETKEPYVFIIDEINRGNISKIFGELITLIEDSKRRGMPEAVEAKLPYSKRPFSVPENVYILGTMNTADRSIAMMDTALRRRFKFVEMLPKPELLADVVVKDGADEVNIQKLLETINKRIECLYDREHTIGHAFFMKLKDMTDDDKKKLAALGEIFQKSVIPLLQEYFYEDYEKIQLVLGDNAKEKDENKFILDKEIKFEELFRKSKGSREKLDLPKKTYKINSKAFDDIESYKQIMEVKQNTKDKQDTENTENTENTESTQNEN